MEHEVDPRDKLLADVGNTDDIEVFNNQVLCAVYIRPQKTSKGLFLPDQTTDEDRFQSKVGLILKMGEAAFNDPRGQWFQGVDLKVNDWIVFRPSDGWAISVGGISCRMFEDKDIRGRIQHPDRVW